MAEQAKYSRYYTYVAPVIKNPTVRSFAPFIFNLLALIIFILFAIRPTVSTILNLQKDIENNQQVFDALTTKSQNLTIGKTNLENMDPEIRKKISNAVPYQVSTTSLVALLQNTISSQGSISSLQIQPVNIYDAALSETLPSKLSNIEFSYTIEGQYIQLLNTLENINQSPRLMTIDNVLITRQGSASATMAVSGKAYFLK